MNRFLEFGLILSFSFSAAAQARFLLRPELKYSQDVTLYQRSLTESDLRFLSEAEFPVNNQEVMEVLDLTDSSSLNMSAWLAERVKVMTDSKQKLGDGAVRVLRSPATWNTEPSADFIAAYAQSRSQVMMSNIGATIYQFGKRTGQVFSLLVNGVGWISIESPRAGVVRIGDGYFAPLKPQWGAETLSRRIARIFRLETLFHEARHSDGRGSHVGFSHVICPKGHTYQGQFACDSMNNGAYRVGALLTQQFKESCTNCSVEEKELLDFLYLDSRSRVLNLEQAQETSLCDYLGAWGAGASYCEKKDPLLKPYFVDPQPEVAP
ncbi:MAG: hypothetical protein LW875_11850 [Proteobacteria bacterium]|nr:hypothetical protein [Pseudomonadota bacterium]